MQLPITIGVRRSRLLDIGLLFIVLLAVGAVLIFPQTTITQGLLLSTILILATLTWRQLSPALSAIRLERGGLISVAHGSETEFLPMLPLPGANIHPWLTVIRLKDETGKVWPVIVTVDSINRQDFRRFRVFMRWQADFKASNDDA